MENAATAPRAAAPSPGGARGVETIVQAAGALALVATYTLLAVFVFLTAQHAPDWRVALVAVPAAILGLAAALGGLAARRRRRA